jgi:hypothetical protein
MLTFLTNLLFCPKAYQGLVIRYISLIIIEKIIIITPKSNTFTETRTRDSFRICDLSSRNLLAETNIFFFAPFFYRAYFPNYTNHLHRETNPGQFFVIVAFVPVISSPKQITFVLAPFFYRA